MQRRAVTAAGAPATAAGGAGAMIRPGDATSVSAPGGIICAGNWIVDRVHTIAYWPEQGNITRIEHQDVGVGGGAANVLTDLWSLGFTGDLAAVGCLGADSDGDLVRAHCLERNIDISGLSTVDGTSTAHTHVMSVPGKSRTFFYNGGANDTLTAEQVQLSNYASKGYRLFYLGYLMLLAKLDEFDGNGQTGAAKLLSAAKMQGFVTCVDFVSSEDQDFAGTVKAALPHCDYVIINEIEAGKAAGVIVRDGSGALDREVALRSASYLVDEGVKSAVVIHAPEGALWFPAEGDAIWRPSIPIDPADIVSSVGAGDAFCAAVLYGLHAGWAPDQILQIAHLAATACLRGPTATAGVPNMSSLLSLAGHTVS